MLEYLKHCPLCEYSDSKTIFTVPSISDEFQNNITKCRKYGLLFVNPRLSESYIRSWYNKQYTSLHEIESRVSFGSAETKRRYTRLQGILRYKSQGKLLDVGCGTGFFLKIVKENNDLAELFRRIFNGLARRLILTTGMRAYAMKT